MHLKKNDNMTTITVEEFNEDPKKYFLLAMREEVLIKAGENVYRLEYKSYPPFNKGEEINVK